MTAHYYRWNDQPVTAEEFAELISDLIHLGWRLCPPETLTGVST